jgi:CheY-like chemotaxis protein
VSGNLSVLVVDDDESIRETVHAALSGEGYEVRLAADGDTALALLQDWRPRLILLDMKMPVKDGWSFAHAFGELPPPRPPVVVFTAASDADAWAAEIDADGVLPKPFGLENLLEVVGRYTAQG